MLPRTDYRSMALSRADSLQDAKSPANNLLKLGDGS